MDNVFLFEPLALEYLAAGLKEDGVKVKILDMRIEDDLSTVLDEFSPDAVGLTAFTNQVNIVKDLARDLKGYDKDIKIIIGGHHATVAPEDFNTIEFDVVVIGEGVFTMKEIVRAFKENGELSEIKGAAFPSVYGLYRTEKREYTELDNLPLPDRELTAKYRKHYFSEWFKPLASVRTSLGCTARCNFCSLWSITGGKYLKRSVSSVVKELQTIKEENIFFCDDESMCDWKRMDLLADEIREAGINKKYFLYARVDTIVRHPEMFKKWADIGLKQVFVGMEDYSDERLSSMNKGVTSRQQVEAVKILKSYGIMMYASFMISPDYTKDDFASLKKYIRDLKLTYATYTVMTPLPGAVLYEKNKHRLISRKPEYFDMLHTLLPTLLPLKDFYYEMSELYKSAIPLHRGFPVLLKFGWKDMLSRIKLLNFFLKRLKTTYLDYQ